MIGSKQRSLADSGMEQKRVSRKEVLLPRSMRNLLEAMAIFIMLIMDWFIDIYIHKDIKFYILTMCILLYVNYASIKLLTKFLQVALAGVAWLGIIL